MAQIRNLEKFEQYAIDVCKDPEYKEKLRLWVQKHKEPLDEYGLKKLKDKIYKHNRKSGEASK